MWRKPSPLLNSTSSEMSFTFHTSFHCIGHVPMRMMFRNQTRWYMFDGWWSGNPCWGYAVDIDVQKLHMLKTKDWDIISVPQSVWNCLVHRDLLDIRCIRHSLRSEVSFDAYPSQAVRADHASFLFTPSGAHISVAISWPVGCSWVAPCNLEFLMNLDDILRKNRFIGISVMLDYVNVRPQLKIRLFRKLSNDAKKR